MNLFSKSDGKLRTLLLPALAVVITGCSNVGLLSDRNRRVLDEISDVGDFFKVYFILQLSIIFVGLLLMFIFGRAGYYISLIAHFIWIISFRDYGFFIVLLLFSFFSIVSFLFNLLIGRRRR